MTLPTTSAAIAVRVCVATTPARHPRAAKSASGLRRRASSASGDQSGQDQRGAEVAGVAREPDDREPLGAPHALGRDAERLEPAERLREAEQPRRARRRQTPAQRGAQPIGVEAGAPADQAADRDDRADQSRLDLRRVRGERRRRGGDEEQRQRRARRSARTRAPRPSRPAAASAAREASPRISASKSFGRRKRPPRRGSKTSGRSATSAARAK